MPLVHFPSAYKLWWNKFILISLKETLLYKWIYPKCVFSDFSPLGYGSLERPFFSLCYLGLFEFYKILMYFFIIKMCCVKEGITRFKRLFITPSEIVGTAWPYHHLPLWTAWYTQIRRDNARHVITNYKHCLAFLPFKNWLIADSCFTIPQQFKCLTIPLLKFLEE